MVEKLLDLVYSNRLLYDLNDIEYTNIRKKDDVWISIGEELNESCKYLTYQIFINYISFFGLKARLSELMHDVVLLKRQILNFEQCLCVQTSKFLPNIYN